MTTKNTYWYAQRYTEKFNMKLVPLGAGSKLPKQKEWGDTETPADYWLHHPEDNVGLNLGASGFCSLDIDCLESFALCLEEFGLPLEDLDDFPIIQGASKGKRLLFKVPEGMTLPYVKLNWPRKDDPKKHYTVFELRASEAGGKARQDVLPPSIHPDTKEPYKWTGKQPCDPWPTPPDWLIAIWTAWDCFKPQLKDACPWAEVTPKPQPKPRDLSANPDDVASQVVDGFLSANDLVTTLETYGYQRRGKRYLSPHSGTGLAGVIMFEGNAACWIHHSSDPLCSEESGQPVNAFDLYTYYEHNGDRSKAFKTAAADLGIKLGPRKKPSQAPSEQPDSRIKPVSDINWIEWPDQTDKGKPLSTIENVMKLCDVYGIKPRYNVIAKEDEVVIPGATYTTDNAAACSLNDVISLANRHRLPPGNVPDYLLNIADRNTYNPCANWVDSRAWDGKDRIDELVETLDSRDPVLAKILLVRWLISAIAALYEPNGVAAHGVLVLQGAQNIGKTSWLMSLLGENKHWGYEGAILNPSDKDSVKLCISHWLVELGELDATFRKSDIAALKSFITSPSDEIFLRYSRRSSKFPRRTVFFASVNPKEYLNDDTGNRRYWTIECGQNLNRNHNIDVQQLWAQIKTLYDAGQKWWLDREEIDTLNAHNNEYETVDPIEELIVSRFDLNLDATEKYTSTDVLAYIGYDKPTNAQARKCGAILRTKLAVKATRSNGRLLFHLPRPKKY